MRYRYYIAKAIVSDHWLADKNNVLEHITTDEVICSMSERRAITLLLKHEEK